MQSSILTSSLLQAIICIILIYAMLSVVASSIAEGLNFYFKERGKMLYNSISAMFEDKMNVNFGQLLYDHPIITALRKDRSNLPQYISPEIFSSCIIDVLGNFSRKYEYDSGENAITLRHGNMLLENKTLDERNIFERCKDTILNMQHTDVKLLLMNMIEKSNYTKENQPIAMLNFQQQLQQWFNAQMDRTTGWYKTKTTVRLRWVAFFIAIGLNINSINLFNSLITSTDLRSQILPIAESVSKNQAQFIDSTTKEIDTTQVKNMKQAITVLDSVNRLGIPIGWKEGLKPITDPDRTNNPAFWGTLWYWLFYFLGIFITAFAVTAGAPFWFDLLAKFINIRKAGIKPEDSKA